MTINPPRALRPAEYMRPNLHDPGRAEVTALVKALQRTLRPPHLPELPGVDVAASYRPVEGVVGGDFLDVFPLRGSSWGAMVGDVCGKGAAAAELATSARYSLRTSAMVASSPARALEITNRSVLADNRAGEMRARFVSLAFHRIRARSDGTVQLRSASAGQLGGVIQRAAGGTEIIDSTGPVLGIFDRPEFDEVVTILRPGDLCVVTTDGATDVRNARRETFGQLRFEHTLAACRGLAARGVVSVLEDAVLGFQDGGQTDDLAMLAIAVPHAPGS